MFAQPLRSSSPEMLHGKYVASLFARGEQGGWYDPSDLSTLFQDAAGTIPVTGVEQPVGRVLDKSGRGNHATQTTTASRPVLSARVNLLTKTEQFDDASWSKFSAVVSTNSAVAPNGTLTADTFIPTSGIVFSAAGSAFVNSISVISQSITVAATTYKYRLCVKDAGYDMGQLRVSEATTLAGSNQAVTRISLLDGAVLTQGGTGNLTGVTATCTRTSDGWCDITLKFTSGSAQTLYFGLWVWNSTAVTSDGIKGLHLWGADLRVANESALIPSYQRVNTATDYDTQGFPLYLRFDGVDDWLVTPTVNFTATNKVTAFAGVRKFSDAAAGAIVELSATPTAADFTARFSVTAAAASLASYGLGMTTNSEASGTYQIRTLTYTAPITNVVSALFDSSFFSGPNRVIPRVNASAPGSIQVGFEQTGAVPTKFGSFPIFIGRRGGTTLPFNGRIYGLIVCGAQTDDLHLTNVERYLANKSGVLL